jgi:hypothetical protein
MRKKVILLLPLTFNDGTAVPGATLDAIYDELFVHYGGYTLAGVVKGAYRMKGGEKQVDDSHEVWVGVEESELEGLRKRVGTFCARLGQEVLYFEVTEATVEFIGPQPEGETP